MAPNLVLDEARLTVTVFSIQSLHVFGYIGNFIDKYLNLEYHIRDRLGFLSFLASASGTAPKNLVPLAKKVSMTTIDAVRVDSHLRIPNQNIRFHPKG